MRRGRGKILTVHWRTTRPLIRWRVRPPKVLIGIIHMVPEVPLAVVPLVLPTEEFSILLGALLTHLIEPHVEASKLISEKLAERSLLGVPWASIPPPTHSIGYLWGVL